MPDSLENEIHPGLNPNLAVPTGSVPAESDHSDVAISDLDSDLEPDQLVSTYIKIKGRLFEIDPEAIESKPHKRPKGAKGLDKKASKGQSPTVRKLLSQLQQLESDALFDQVEADIQWPVKRNNIAQARAAQRREQDITRDGNSEQPAPQNSAPGSTTSKNQESPPVVSDPHPDEDDTSMLGDMFAAVPDNIAPTDEVANARTSIEKVTLRDFGKQSGITPRRTLEEVVRARSVSHSIK